MASHGTFMPTPRSSPIHQGGTGVFLSGAQDLGFPGYRDLALGFGESISARRPLVPSLHQVASPAIVHRNTLLQV